MEFYNTLHR